MSPHRWRDASTLPRTNGACNCKDRRASPICVFSGFTQSSRNLAHPSDPSNQPIRMSGLRKNEYAVKSRRFSAGAIPARPIGRSAGSNRSDGGGSEFVEVLWCNGSSTVNRLAHLDLNSMDLNCDPLANYYQQLAHENRGGIRVHRLGSIG
jgi:hypothetical protein